MKDSTQRLQPTYSLEEDRLNALKQILPEAFADGKINFDTLRELLGDDVEEERDEHFGLSWTGKREARRLAGLPSKGTLVPVAGEGVDEATTENIFIEGDNLEVLKLLHKSYRGKIKMIYIDPPYNTGNDFIYKDDYREPLESYLQRSGQMTDAGELLSSNAKGEGRFHSNWLNMVYPRLRVARDLLRDDGVIFISIDDNEVHNLRQIMNEIFGEENFVTSIAWQSRQSIQNDTDISVNHEYLVAYAKVRRLSNRRLKESNKEQWYKDNTFAVYPLPLEKDKFSNPDNDPRGLWKANPFDAPGVRPNLTYEIENPNTGEKYLPPQGRHWGTEEPTYKKLFDDKRILFGTSGTSRPQVKVFYEEKKEFGSIENTWFDGQRAGTATKGTKELQSLFNGIAPFDTPKPTTLIKQLLRLSTKSNDIVLDFFSGSGTSTQAVMELNNEDNGNRKFICVQIPEKVPNESAAKKLGFETISDLTKERIRRAIKKIKSESKSDAPLLQQAETGDSKQDLGFKVFRLERSNFRAWTDFTGQELSDFRPLLEAAESPFVSEASPDGILTEILLLEGFPLNSKTEIDPAFERNKVIRVSSEFSEHRLFITLDEEVWEETIDHAAELEKNDIFICLDNALSDENKVRLSDVCRLKTI